MSFIPTVENFQIFHVMHVKSNSIDRRFRRFHVMHHSAIATQLAVVTWNLPWDRSSLAAVAALCPFTGCRPGYTKIHEAEKRRSHLVKSFSVPLHNDEQRNIPWWMEPFMILRSRAPLSHQIDRAPRLLLITSSRCGTIGRLEISAVGDCCREPPAVMWAVPLASHKGYAHVSQSRWRSRIALLPIMQAAPSALSQSERPRRLGWSLTFQEPR